MTRRGVTKGGITEGGVAIVVPIFVKRLIPTVLIFVSFVKVIVVRDWTQAVIPIPGGPIIAPVIIPKIAGPLSQRIEDTKHRLVEGIVAQV